MNPAPDTLCLANARLILPDQVLNGWIRVKDGVIDEIGEGNHTPEGALNCAGDYVLPGLIELHTDNLERHIEPRPQVHWPHLPALIAHDAELASTGITTVFDALRVGSTHVTTLKKEAYARRLADELLQARAAGCFKISHFLHLRAEICSQTLLEEMAEFGPDDRVGIVSLMDHTPGQRQFRDLAALKVFLTRKRTMNDAEFSEHVAALRDLRATYGDPHEAGAIKAARRYGATLASHDDTTQEQVTNSHANGVRIAEFPTTLEAAQTCRAKGIAIMMGAPNLVRGQSHSGNVSALTLAEARLLDIISSDYIPAALLVSAFQLSQLWDDLPRAMACVTANPAQAVGLEDRGALRVGLRGDLLRVGIHDATPLIRGVWSAGERIS